MRINSEPLRNAVETAAAALEARGDIPPPPPELGGESFSDLLESGRLKLEIDPKFPQAIGISSILSRVFVFGNFRWDILINDFPESPFFTSDFPAAIEETEDRRVLNRVFPLAPDIAVRVKPDLSIDRDSPDFSFSKFQHHARRLSYDEASQVNRSIVRCAEDAVFYRDDAAWVRKFIERNRNYRIEPSTYRFATTEGTTSFSTQKIAPYVPPQ